jgi:hypothetical protein
MAEIYSRYLIAPKQRLASHSISNLLLLPEFSHIPETTCPPLDTAADNPAGPVSSVPMSISHIHIT